MRTLKFLTVITIFLVMFSCSITPSGSEYLGKWALKLKYAYWEMNITRVGESFLVEGTFNQDGIYTITKENNLVQSGFMSTTITYDKKTNTLIVSSGDDIDRWTRLQDKAGDQSRKKELAGKSDKNNNSLIPKIKRLFKKKIKDIDGNVYSTVKIGKQVWMVENLRTTKFNDGSSIANITSEEQWNDASRPGYCWYDNDIDNKNTYGALYNWHAVETGILCPNGWHVPSDTEWTELETYLANNGYNYDGSTGGDDIRDKIAKSMASDNGWETSSGVGEIGNTDYPEYRNKSGFTALPGGYRLYNGSFNDVGYYGSWWSSTQSSTNNAWSRVLNYDGSYVGGFGYNKENGFSVRCVRD
ncbi:MAG: fibrobacter succinogenes major paralogous domain-containing protein [Bacteroidales bacterium]|nr:fibrobacter succinogenes major paralogous domain-containing protein [Bacteroidales bacterium]